MRCFYTFIACAGLLALGSLAHADTPKRLPPWTALDSATRQAIVAAWDQQPLLKRPPFPVFRDEWLEKMRIDSANEKKEQEKQSADLKNPSKPLVSAP